MLSLDWIRRLYGAIPTPITWLFACVIIFVWLLLVASFFFIIKGGYDELAKGLPSYAKSTALKLFQLYFFFLLLYLVAWLTVILIERRRKLGHKTPKRRHK